jgi:DNA-binding NarL/FixJ family response regulator
VTPITVLVVDDHPVVRHGLRSLLASYPDVRVIGEAASGPAAVAAVTRSQPDVVLMDIRLGGLDGIQVTERLRSCEPAPRVIILTSYDDDGYLVRALQAGAHAYLMKSASDETLVDAIRTVHRGERLLSPALLDRVLQQFAGLRHAQMLAEVGLTAEEGQLLTLLAEGASNADIADVCHWSTTSVKRRLQEIFAKMQVRTRAQAAAEGVRRGLA